MHTRIIKTKTLNAVSLLIYKCLCSYLYEYIFEKRSKRNNKYGHRKNQKLASSYEFNYLLQVN